MLALFKSLTGDDVPIAGNEVWNRASEKGIVDEKIACKF